MDGRLYSGDEIVAVDGQSVMGASHHVVVGMMGSAAQRGQVQLTVRRRSYQGETFFGGFSFGLGMYVGVFLFVRDRGWRIFLVRVRGWRIF
jgi:hypothetical protein